MKYRIVQRNDGWYYAQEKLFGLFWVDCRNLDITKDSDLSYDDLLKTVESYVQSRLKSKPKQTVIKTY